jgi:thiamine biosynthesis lipoprotein
VLAKLIEISSSFRAMNTDVQIILCVPLGQKKRGERALKRTQQLFKQAEETLSRFNPKSELTCLNSSAGSQFKASPLLFAVIEESLKAARATGGIFDPTILPGLLASGYNQSFEKLAEPTHAAPPNIPGTKCRWQDIILYPGSSSVYLPAGCSIDLGGIGKGWTVDKASNGLEDIDNFVIDAGGDIRGKGRKADGLPWTVGVADPFVEGRILTVVELQEGAICTSTSIRRKWELNGKLQHHLIDPRSGEPSRSGVVSATIIAGSAVRAEIISKTALILGAEDGLRFIESQPNASGLLVLEDKQLRYSKCFKELVYAS